MNDDGEETPGTLHVALLLLVFFCILTVFLLTDFLALLEYFFSVCVYEFLWKCATVSSKVYLIKYCILYYLLDL